MKKIIIDRKDIKAHEKIDVSLLSEGFIFNECGLVINGIEGINHPFKIGLQFYPDRNGVYISVYGKQMEIITFYFFYTVMAGFQFGRIGRDINQEDPEEICAAVDLINLAMDACMTIKDAAYERAILYKKKEDERKFDESQLRQLKKIKKRNKMQDIYLLEDTIAYMATTLPEEKLKRHMNCPVWDVRGFYRHYKNGMVKWINGFQKGRDRNKGKETTDRTYIAGRKEQ